MKFIPEGLRRPFRYRNYRLYFMGQVVSMLGLWMHSVASSWLVYRLTDSSLLLGIVSFASMIPLLIFSPIGGAIADAFDRRKIVFCTQILMVIGNSILAFRTISGAITVPEIMIIAFCIGTVSSIDGPARQAFIMEIVGPEELPNAIALNSSMSNAMRLVGPMLAGILIPFIGEGGIFLVHGTGYCFLVVSLLFMRYTPREIKKTGKNAFTSIKEGFGFAAANPGIRTILLTLGGVGLLSSPASVLLPVFVGSDLGGEAASLGVLLSASGIGAFVGALALASRTGREGLLGWIFWASIIISTCVALLCFAGNIPVAAMVLMLSGLGQSVLVAGLNTILQLATPDEYRGRIMSLFSMMIMGIAPFGSLAGGYIAEIIGTRMTFALAGLGLAMLFAVAIPSVIKYLRLDGVDKGEKGEAGENLAL